MLGQLLVLVLVCSPASAAQTGGLAAPERLNGASVSAADTVLARARRLLEVQMPVSASILLARELSADAARSGEAALLAASAYAEQRAWNDVLRLLGHGEPSGAERARATLLLARAYAGLDSATQAAAHYGAYLEAVGGEASSGGAAEGAAAKEKQGPEPSPMRDRSGEFRLARVEYAQALERAGRLAEAKEQLAIAEAELPDIAHWLRLSRLYLVAESDEPAAFGLADSIASEGSAPKDSALVPAARLAFRTEQPDRGVALARRLDKGAWNELAAWHTGPHFLATGDSAAAAAAFADAIKAGLASYKTGPLLVELSRSWRTLRDVGRSDSRSGWRERAVGYLAEALELAPEAERPGIAGSLASAYLALGKPRQAAEVLDPWLDGDSGGGAGSRASLWLARARAYEATGERGKAAEAREIAATGSGEAAARTAYLLADERHDAADQDGAAAAFETAFRRFSASSYGQRSLERAALIAFHARRYEEARSHLAEYVARYPGEPWRQGAEYWIARVDDARGNGAAALARYLEVVRLDPLDYYAILAAPRAGIDRWQTIALAEPVSLPTLDGVYRTAIERMNKLRKLGWLRRAQTEYRAARRRGPSGYGQILAFAYALHENGWSYEGIREGWRAHQARGRWSRQLLEAIYPLPFKDALVAAAERNGLSAHFVAGISRRESMFDPEIESSAGAVGLMQLLPETGSNISRRAGVPGYKRGQLTVPEVNLLLGSRYLAEMISRFDGFEIAGMISYNAGPHRYERWRDFPEFGDAEELVERIPYRETREYVRAVTELSEMYRFLYPELSNPPPARTSNGNP